MGQLIVFVNTNIKYSNRNTSRSTRIPLEIYVHTLAGSFITLNGAGAQELITIEIHCPCVTSQSFVFLMSRDS